MLVSSLLFLKVPVFIETATVDMKSGFIYAVALHVVKWEMRKGILGV